MRSEDFVPHRPKSILLTHGYKKHIPLFYLSLSKENIMSSSSEKTISALFLIITLFSSSFLKVAHAELVNTGERTSAWRTFDEDVNDSTLINKGIIRVHEYGFGQGMWGKKSDEQANYTFVNEENALIEVISKGRDIRNEMSGMEVYNRFPSKMHLENKGTIIVDVYEEAYGLKFFTIGGEISAINNGDMKLEAEVATGVEFFASKATIENSGQIALDGSRTFGINVGAKHTAITNTGEIIMHSSLGAEVLILGSFKAVIDTYATSFRKFYDNYVFALNSFADLHFNNTHLIARPWLPSEGFEFGKKYPLIDMIDAEDASKISGSIAKASTDNALVSVTLEGDDIFNQSLTFHSAISEISNEEMQEFFIALEKEKFNLNTLENRIEAHKVISELTVDDIQKAIKK